MAQLMITHQDKIAFWRGTKRYGTTPTAAEASATQAVVGKPPVDGNSDGAPTVGAKHNQSASVSATGKVASKRG